MAWPVPITATRRTTPRCRSGRPESAAAMLVSGPNARIVSGPCSRAARSASRAGDLSAPTVCGGPDAPRQSAGSGRPAFPIASTSFMAVDTTTLASAFPKLVEMPTMSNWWWLASQAMARQSSGSVVGEAPQAASVSIQIRLAAATCGPPATRSSGGTSRRPVRQAGTGSARDSTSNAAMSDATTATKRITRTCILIRFQ